MDRDSALLLVGAVIAFGSSVATACVIYSFSLRTSKLKREEEEKAGVADWRRAWEPAIRDWGECEDVVSPGIRTLGEARATERNGEGRCQANATFASVQKALMNELEQADELLQIATARRSQAGETQDSSAD